MYTQTHICMHTYTCIDTHSYTDTLTHAQAHTHTSHYITVEFEPASSVKKITIRRNGYNRSPEHKPTPPSFLLPPSPSPPFPLPTTNPPSPAPPSHSQKQSPREPDSSSDLPCLRLTSGAQVGLVSDLQSHRHCNQSDQPLQMMMMMQSRSTLSGK